MRRPPPQFCLSLSTDQGHNNLKLVHRGTDLRDSDSVGWGQGGGENPQILHSPGTWIYVFPALPGRTWRGPASLCPTQGWGSSL